MTNVATQEDLESLQQRVGELEEKIELMVLARNENGWLLALAQEVKAGIVNYGMSYGGSATNPIDYSDKDKVHVEVREDADATRSGRKGWFVVHTTISGKIERSTRTKDGPIGPFVQRAVERAVANSFVK